MIEMAIQRQRKIQAIAGEDDVYCVWAASYEECRENFAQFANAQPEDIRNYLWGYAETGRLMYQRMLNIACENMRFPSEI